MIIFIIVIIVSLVAYGAVHFCVCVLNGEITDSATVMRCVCVNICGRKLPHKFVSKNATVMRLSAIVLCVHTNGMNNSQKQ